MSGWLRPWRALSVTCRIASTSVTWSDWPTLAAPCSSSVHDSQRSRGTGWRPCWLDRTSSGWVRRRSSDFRRTCAPSMSGSFPTPTAPSTEEAFPLKTLEYLRGGSTDRRDGPSGDQVAGHGCRHDRRGVGRLCRQGGERSRAAPRRGGSPGEAVSRRPQRLGPAGSGVRTDPRSSRQCDAAGQGAVRVGSSFGPGMTQLSPTRMIPRASNGAGHHPRPAGARGPDLRRPVDARVPASGRRGHTGRADGDGAVLVVGERTSFSATTTPGSASRHARSTGRWPSSQRHSCSATGPATSRPGPPWRPAQPIGRCCSSWHGPE